MKQLWGRCSVLALAQVCCLEGTGCRKWLYRNRFHSQGIKKATRGPAPSLPGSTTVGRPVLTAPTFLNPQLHTPIYYSPLKFIICGSLQLLCYSVQFSHSVVSDTLRPHRLQHARLPCPSPFPRACSNSCPLSQ